jgi:hypothetical protein
MKLVNMESKPGMMGIEATAHTNNTPHTIRLQLSNALHLCSDLVTKNAKTVSKFLSNMQ